MARQWADHFGASRESAQTDPVTEERVLHFFSLSAVAHISCICIYIYWGAYAAINCTRGRNIYIIYTLFGILIVVMNAKEGWMACWFRLCGTARRPGPLKKQSQWSWRKGVPGLQINYVKGRNCANFKGRCRRLLKERKRASHSLPSAYHLCGSAV